MCRRKSRPQVSHGEAVECYKTRWLLSTSTSLASFVRSFVGNGRREYQGMAADLWPVAAPYPGLLKKKQGAAVRAG